ncbi:MAG: bifunctional orotidine-5'-phosphate decarboxylase/orotate phosphoribosyltransferase [Microcystaceae cyanobacterium]
MSFFEKLSQAIAQNNSLLIVGLDPNPEMLPSWMGDNKRSLMQNLEDWLVGVIEKTKDHVCAYKPTLGFYEALGNEGFTLFMSICQAIPQQIPIILDSKYGDLNTSSLLARTIFEQWNVDAVTLVPLAGQDQAAPFLVYPDRGVFCLCHTSNPDAEILQAYPTVDNPFYLHLIEEVKQWGTPEQLGLEIGTGNPNILQTIRQISPERLILLRSLWRENTDLTAMLTAGLDHNGEGLLIPIPQDYLSQDSLSEQVIQLQNKVNQVRHEVQTSTLACDLWTSDLPPSSRHPHQDLILQLYDLGCLLFGDYVQSSGATFSYYVDLRQIISNPQVFHQVLKAYADILESLTFDRIAGIPYGSLPTATGLSLMLNYPMIYPRKEVKAHGTRRLIEGIFEAGETVVVIDDILITGNSIVKGAEKIESAGLVVKDMVVFIDHGAGVKDRIRGKGYNAYSVLTISEITETLYDAKRINKEQYDCLIQEGESD